MPETIIIVKDEPAIQDAMAYNLEKQGFAVEAVQERILPIPDAL